MRRERRETGTGERKGAAGRGVEGEEAISREKERERELKKNERAKKELQIDASHGQQGSRRHGEKRKMRLKSGRQGTG